MAVVVPVPWFPSSFTTDPRWLLDGMVEFGHDAILVCATGSEQPPDVPIVIASHVELESPAFWSRLKVDVAVIFTWMTKFFGTVSAVRRAGAFVVSKGDTDGLIGTRVHPHAAFVRTVYLQRGVFSQARAVWHWAKKYAVLYKEEDSRLLANLAAAHATTVETQAAKDNLLPLLQHYGAAHLWNRIHVIPSAVSREIVSAPVAPRTERRVVSVGRWDSPEKNIRLLQRVVRRTLRFDPNVSFLIVGAGAEPHFSNPGARVDCTGRIPHEQMQHLLGSARICLITSRWESFHLAAHEAMALGCSLVGTDIPLVREVVASGRFGRVGGKTSRRLATGLQAELRAWDEGKRDPLEIAAYCRGRVAPQKVAARIAELPQDTS